jgi:hypothetical protein
MLTIAPTPHNAGVEISGDREDLNRLYDALAEIVDDESESGSEYEMPALNILAVNYELRHAWQGSRSIAFIANGLSPAAQQNLKKLGPQHNVYFVTRITVPEILFAIMALNDFVEIYSRKVKIPALNRDIQMVQLFQAEVTAALQSLLGPAAADRLARLVYGTVPRFCKYMTHYVEMLTGRYLRLAPEKRVQQILPLARRISERGADYQRFVRELEETAGELKCSPIDLEPENLPPELNEADW